MIECCSCFLDFNSWLLILENESTAGGRQTYGDNGNNDKAEHVWSCNRSVLKWAATVLRSISNVQWSNSRVMLQFDEVRCWLKRKSYCYLHTVHCSIESSGLLGEYFLWTWGLGTGGQGPGPNSKTILSHKPAGDICQSYGVGHT